MQLRKVAVSAFLLGLGVYIWLPTADEIVIHPTFGLFLSIVLQINYAYGVLLSIIIYRIIGSACILGSILIGGKPVYNKLKEKLKKNKQCIKSVFLTFTKGS
jgi:hypothetical protein